MENDNLQKDVMKESKEYVSVSTRLPMVDMVNLKLYCNKNNIPPSEYIRNLIHKNLNSPKKTFLSGKNKIRYDKTTNSFTWLVQFDSGEETEVLKNLSDDFLKNLNQQIQEAIKERTQWIHHTKLGSVEVPGEMIGGENG